MIDPWAILLTLGPLLLLGVIVYASVKNRKARKEGGRASLGTTNAVSGSEKARPDLDAEIARAEEGDDKPG